MALNSAEFVLKEGQVEYGAWANPHLIDPGTDPEASFTATDNVGYIRMGTISVVIADEFVEYLANTPHEIVRKDLLRRNFGLNFTANQFNETNYGLFYRFDTESGLYSLAHVGFDVPTQVRYGFLLTGEKVDGSELKVAIYSGAFVTEDKSLTFPGTDYVDIPIQIQAFRHPSFIANENNLRCYGLIYEQGSS